MKQLNSVEQSYLDDVQQQINFAKEVGKFPIGMLSDGFHTFDELYEHRIELFITLCSYINDMFSHDQCPVWITDRYSDGSKTEEGWFLAGIYTEKGKQISYHLPMKYWNEMENWASRVLHTAPEFDGHTSKDVLERIKWLR